MGREHFEVIAFGLFVMDTLIWPVGPEVFSRDSTQVQMRQSLGGDAANAAVNAAAMGLSTALVSCAGQDADAAFLLDALHRAGVDTAGVALLPGCSTARSLVLTGEDGERHFLSSTDIFSQIRAEQVSDELLSGGGALSLDSFYRMEEVSGEAAADLFARARRAGRLTFLDTMPCREGNPMERIAPALRQTDVFLPSYDEAVQITGERDPRQMARALGESGAGALIVKLGGKGAYVTDFVREQFIPAFVPPRVESTVGAGDCFCAGMMAGMLRGRDLFSAARFACAAAALTVGVQSATGGVRSFSQVLDFMGEGQD